MLTLYGCILVRPLHLGTACSAPSDCILVRSKQRGLKETITIHYSKINHDQCLTSVLVTCPIEFVIPIFAAMTTLAYILLHTFWGVIFFAGLDRGNYIYPGIVLATHMFVSCMVSTMGKD